MQEVVHREKTGVLILIALPGHGAIVANALQHRASIRAFRELDDHSETLCGHD